MKQELAERAVFLKGDFQSKYGLSAQEVATLTKISFYDIFFLCGGYFTILSDINSF